jgi:phosphoribosylamine-glycine ligase
MGLVGKDADCIANIPCFAPSKEAAQLEGSKAYAKDFMKRYDIPTAEYRNFTSYKEAKQYLESTKSRVVLKASDLAAGKGVVLPKTLEEGLEVHCPFPSIQNLSRLNHFDNYIY